METACEAGIVRILCLLSLLKCSVAKLRTMHKVVLRELNHSDHLGPSDLTKVDDMVDYVAKRILVVMLILHPLLQVAFLEFFGRSCAGQTSAPKSTKFKLC